jgi:hypothetical protein
VTYETHFAIFLAFRTLPFYYDGSPVLVAQDILSVLYGCETWLLTIGEGNGVRVFENRVLRRIFEGRVKKTTHYSAS